jgi:hypothetical protein
MKIREQRIIFTAMVAVMFCGVMAATIYCPPVPEDQRLVVFLFDVASVLLPSLGFLALTRKLQSLDQRP